MAAVEKTDPATTPPVQTAPKPERQIIPVAVDIDNPMALYVDTGVFEQLQRVAKLMATSSLAPAHLRGAEKVSDCFLVVSQAFRWRMDPFAVMQHTFVLQGKLGYEGKLIAAVVNTNPRIDRALSYTYEGEGATRRVTVSGTLRGETEPRTVTGTVAGWKTSNDKWASMPDQMLAYRGAREWARRHMPEAVLGIYADDDLMAIDGGSLEAGADGAYRPAPRGQSAAARDIQAALTSGTVIDAAPAVEPTPTPPAHPKDALFDDLPTQIDPKWADYIEKRALDIDECEDAESLGTVHEGFKIVWASGEVPLAVQDELTRQIAEKEKKLAAKTKRK